MILVAAAIATSLLVIAYRGDVAWAWITFSCSKRSRHHRLISGCSIRSPVGASTYKTNLRQLRSRSYAPRRASSLDGYEKDTSDRGWTLYSFHFSSMGLWLGPQSASVAVERSERDRQSKPLGMKLTVL